MRLLTRLAAALFLSALAVPLLGQDAIDSVKVDPAHHQVVIENSQVRVLRWTIPVGDKTLNHSHPRNVNVDLNDYNGKVTLPGGRTSDVHVKAGSVTWRDALIHVVENIGTEPMLGIIVEPRKPASTRPAGSQDPIVVDPQHQKVEFENDQIRVLRERQSGSFPMHGHPDNVQIVLTDMNVVLTAPDGTTQPVTAKAGTVRWRTAAQHSGRVVGDKPFEQIVIEMKAAPVGPTAGK